MLFAFGRVLLAAVFIVIAFLLNLVAAFLEIIAEKYLKIIGIIGGGYLLALLCTLIGTFMEWFNLANIAIVFGIVLLLLVVIFACAVSYVGEGFLALGIILFQMLFVLLSKFFELVVWCCGELIILADASENQFISFIVEIERKLQKNIENKVK